MGVNPVAQRTPMIEGAGEVKTLKIFDCAIYGHPRHDFGVRELLSPSANLPDALVGLHPDPFKIFDPVSFDGHTMFRDTHSALPRLVHGISNFAVDIQLELSGGGVADPHGLRLRVAG